MRQLAFPRRSADVAGTAAALARRRDDAAHRAASRCPARGSGRVRPRPGLDGRHRPGRRQPDHDDELPRLDGEDDRRGLQEEDGHQRQAGRRPDLGHLRGGGAGLAEQGQLRHVARRPGARRAAEEGQPAPAGRLLEDPERQERRQALPRRVSVGPADRLRQDRLRLPQGPDLRDSRRAGPTSGSSRKKYSGKVTLLDFDVDILGMALKYKGYSINSANEKPSSTPRATPCSS